MSSSSSFGAAFGGSSGGGGSASSFLQAFGGRVGGGSSSKNAIPPYVQAMIEGKDGWHASAGGFLGDVQNSLGNLGSEIVHAPAGFVDTGKVLFHDFTHPSTRALVGTALAAGNPIIGAIGDPHSQTQTKLIQPATESYRYKYGPVFTHPLSESSWSKTAHRALIEDPLGTIMDATLILSVAGKAALLGAKGGVRGGLVSPESRLGQLAVGKRVLHLPPGLDVTPENVKAAQEVMLTLRRSKTLHGRVLENMVDRLGMKHPNWPAIGVGQRTRTAFFRDMANSRVGELIDARRTATEIHGLSTAEKRAFPYMNKGPLSDPAALASYYEKQLAEAAPEVRPFIESQLADLRDPAVIEAMTNPSSRLVRALHEDAALSERSTQLKIAQGSLTPETHANRLTLEGRIVGGAKEGESPQALAHKASQQTATQAGRRVKTLESQIRRKKVKLAETRGRLKERPELQQGGAEQVRHEQLRNENIAKLEGGVENAKQSLSKRRERLAAAQGSGRSTVTLEKQVAAAERVLASRTARLERIRKGPTQPPGLARLHIRQQGQLRELETRLDHATQALDDARMAVTKAPKGRGGRALVGGPTPEEVRAYQEAWRRGEVAQHVPQSIPDAYYRYHGTLGTNELKARFGRKASSLRAFTQSEGHHNLGTMFATARNTLDPYVTIRGILSDISRGEQEDVIHNYLLPRATPLTPELLDRNPDLLKTHEVLLPGEARLPPEVDLALKTAQEAASHEEIFNPEMVAGERADWVQRILKPEMPLWRALEKAKEGGAYVVRKQDAAQVRREFGPKGETSKLAKWLIDKPTEVWRWLVLKLRPAWAVTNVAGNGILQAMGGNWHLPGAYLRLLHDHGILNPKLLGKFIGIAKDAPPVQRGIIGDALQRAAPGIFNHGQYSLFDSSLVPSDAAAITRYVEKAQQGRIRYANPLHWVKSFGNFNAEMVRKAENFQREASLYSELRPEIKAELKKVQSFGEKAGSANEAIAQAIKNIDDPVKLQHAGERVLDVLGDYNSLNRFERGVIRRFVPFYGWYKAITMITLKMPLNNPIRSFLFLEMGKIGQRDDPGLLPSWLQGAIPLPFLGKHSLLGTQTINPFTTVDQLASAVVSIVTGKPQAGATGGQATDLAGPIPQAVLSGLSGKDSQGNSLYTPGSKRGPLPRGLGYLLFNLPEVGLVQHTLGGRAVPGTSYRPIHQAYPSSLYENTNKDWLLRWFVAQENQVNPKVARERALKGE